MTADDDLQAGGFQEFPACCSVPNLPDHPESSGSQIKFTEQSLHMLTATTVRHNMIP